MINSDMRRRSAGGYVYFILHKNLPPGVDEKDYGRNGYDVQRNGWDGYSYVKIGVATRCKDRLNGLQTSNPIPLEFLGCLYGGIETERELHKFFREYKTCGEWFKYVESVRLYIESLHLMDVEGAVKHDDCGVTPNRFICGIEGVEPEYDKLLEDTKNGKRKSECHPLARPWSTENREFMERLFKGRVEHPVAKKFHVDQFFQPIRTGEAYYKVDGGSWDAGYKYSEKSVDRILSTFFHGTTATVPDMVYEPFCLPLPGGAQQIKLDKLAQYKDTMVNPNDASEQEATK